MKYNNEVNYILVLGQVGAGKTTFVNTIIKSNIFKIDDGPYGCTKKCQIGRLTFENKHYSFIDTPGLDDDESEIEINKAIYETPNIKCIILLLGLYQTRISISIVKLLQKLIKRFPIKNFWEHIIVVRNRVDEFVRRFEEDEIEKKKNILFNYVLDEESMINYMKNYGIAIPNTINEYYFGKSNKREIVEDYKYNSKEFLKILNEINNLSSLN